MTDPFAQFKAVQREAWSHFAPLAVFTTVPAADLVRFAEVKPGQSLLDVACGTGVVSVTAARSGARVRALDLSPALLEHARTNAEIAGTKITFIEGDVEALPYEDETFDVVLSQFGHMFAPRPDVAVSEMLRVLRPGGRIAFSTWPPDQILGRIFALVSRYMPPPPGVAAPPAWGDPSIVAERLGASVKDLHFGRGLLQRPVLSPQHHCTEMEGTSGPVRTLIGKLASEPEKLAAFRAELEALVAAYIVDNAVHQHYLMTRATKV
jgi:SAM-dependent methyltransferase